MTGQALDFTPSTELRRDLQRWRARALAAGVVGLLLTVAGLFLVSPNQFYRSYLWSFVFYLGVSVGCLAWLMLQYLTGGARHHGAAAPLSQIALQFGRNAEVQALGCHFSPPAAG